MCVSEVVRGGDLLKSTARQLLIYRALIGGGRRGGRDGGREDVRREKKGGNRVEKGEREQREKGIEGGSAEEEEGNRTDGNFNDAVPSSSTTTSPSIQNSLPFIIPSFYHCDLVRDYNTHKRISKRNQDNNQDNNDENGVEEGNVIKSMNMIDENVLENEELLLSSSIDDDNEVTSNNGSKDKNENNSAHVNSLNLSIQISSIPASSTTTTTTSISLNNKMDTSSEMFTLRYLREIGYTPDRIKTEILDLNSEFLY